MLETKPEVPAGAGGKPCGAEGGKLLLPRRMCQREMNLKCSPFSHASLFVYKSLQNAFYYLWGNEIKQEISVAFSPSDLCWSIFSPPHFISSTSEAFKGTVPPVIASQFQGLRINNIVITHFTNFQEEILLQQM